VVTAAYKKLAGYKSAKFTMVMQEPGEKGASASSMKASGTLGWNPTVMDMTIDAADLGEDATGDMRMKMIDSVMYMDYTSLLKGDPEAAKAFGGKQWMKMDFNALAKDVSGGAGIPNLNASLGDQQSPAEQLGSMLQAPQISHVGAETVDGVKAEHYKGRITVEEAMASNAAVKGLSAEDRKKVLDGMKKAGITAEDVDVWVGPDSFPVRTDVVMNTAKGKITVSEHLSDYSTKPADVQAPPADQTFSLEDMMKDLQTATTS
jgi:hypothetical protein